MLTNRRRYEAGYVSASFPKLAVVHPIEHSRQLLLYAAFACAEGRLKPRHRAAHAGLEFAYSSRLTSRAETARPSSKARDLVTYITLFTLRTIYGLKCVDVILIAEFDELKFQRILSLELALGRAGLFKRHRRGNVTAAVRIRSRPGDDKGGATTVPAHGPLLPECAPDPAQRWAFL